MDQSQKKLNEYVKQLREEARHAKQCFTQYSFQTLAFASAAIGIIFSASKDNPLSSLAVIPITLLLVVMCWIGIYKYTVANRAYGYQMYISKVMTIYSKNFYRSETESSKALGLIIAQNHWEQTFRIVRAVESTVFNNVYETPYSKHKRNKSWRENAELFCNMIYASLMIGFIIGIYGLVVFETKTGAIIPGVLSTLVVFVIFHIGGKKILYRFYFGMFTPNKETRDILKKYDNLIIKKNKEELSRSKIYPWFMTKKNFRPVDIEPNSNVFYHTGTYLKNMLRILIFMQVLSLTPLIVSILSFLKSIIIFVIKDNNNSAITKIPFEAILNSLYTESIDEKIKVIGFFSTLFMFFLLVCLIVIQGLHIDRRRVILDQELHTASSYSEIWHIVSIIHFRAYQRAYAKACESLDSTLVYTYDGSAYMEEVNVQLQILSKRLFQLQDWFTYKYSRQNEPIDEQTLSQV